MDILVGTDSGKIAWYSGSDSGDSVPALTSEGYLYSQGAQIQVSSPVPFVFDYNDDGLKDLLVGSQAGKIYVFINTGTAEQYQYGDGYFLLETESGPLDFGYTAVPQAIDLTGDGFEDIVVAHHTADEGYISFLENNGPSTPFVFNDPVAIYTFWGDSLTVHPDLLYPYLKDINGDQGADIVTGEYFGEVFYYQGEEPEGVADQVIEIAGILSLVIQTNPVSGSLLACEVGIPNGDSASLYLYDLSGRSMDICHEVDSEAAQTEVLIDNLPNGVYTAVLRSSRGSVCEIFTVLR